MKQNKKKRRRDTMSIKKQGRKSIIIAMIMTLLGASFLPSIAKADHIIDTTKKGSITIYKYDGEEVEGLHDYPTQAEAQAAATAAVAAGDITPMEGVGFSYLKVGSVKQYTKNEGTEQNVTKIGYSLDAATIAFLGLVAADVDFTDADGVDYYTTTMLQGKLAAKTQTQVEAFMSANLADNMPLTNASGTSTVANLDLGLYLFIESVYPSNATSITAPFFVSVPMTDKAADDSYSWIYDINVFPKNQVQPIDIDKNIVDENGNEMKQVDAEIGESVPFLVRADVPLQIGRLLKYTITDTLSVGLTYDTGSYAVQGVKEDGTRVTLVNGTDFTFTQTGQEIKWDFTTTAMADASGLALYKLVEIRYTAKPNEHAVVGVPGNPNDITLEYSKNTNIEDEDDDEIITKVPVELPKVYTYAIDLLKFGDSDTANPLEGVEFELLDKDRTKMNVSQTTAGVDGSYYLNATGTAVIKTLADGKIYIKGLEAGTYYLKETATNQGYNLLAEEIEIIITSNEGTYTQSAIGTFAPITAGAKYYRDANQKHEFIIPAGLTTGTYVNFGRVNVYDEDGDPVTMYIQNPLAWSANYAMGVTNGVIVLKVNNTRGFLIPKTGDTTAMLLYGIGAALAATAIIGSVATKKKKKQEETV